MNIETNKSQGMSGALMRGAALIGFVKLLSAFIGLISTIILARLLLPEDFGLIAIAMVSLYLVSVISELSLSSALVQLDDVEDIHYDTCFTLAIIRSLIIAAILFLIAGPVADFYDDIRLKNIFIAISASMLIGGFLNPKTAEFIRNLDFKADMIMALVEKVSGFIITIITAFILRSYWALVIGFIGSQICKIIVSYILISYRPRLSLKKSGDVLGFSIWITLGNWVQTLNWRSDPLVLGYFISIQMLGYYNMAQRVNHMASRDIIAPVARVLFPAFSRMKSDPERLRLAYLKALSILTSIAFPTAAGLGLLAEPFTALVLGEKWLPIVPYVQALSVIAIFQAMQNVQPLAMATGHTKALLGRDIRSLIIRAPLLFAGLYIGYTTEYEILMCAIIGRGIADFINMVWNMQLVTQITSITIIDHIRAFSRPLIATAIMASAVFISMYFAPMVGTALFLKVALWVLLGVGVYATVLLGTYYASGKPDGPEKVAFGLIAKILQMRKSS